MQAELRRCGVPIFFEPAAVVHHRNRPGLRNMMRRNYRWGYSAIESKAESGAARLAWAYRHPLLLLAASGPLALATSVYVLSCWIRAGVVEPLLMFPLLFAARVAYAVGMTTGGIRWIMRRGDSSRAIAPRWS